MTGIKHESKTAGILSQHPQRRYKKTRIQNGKNDITTQNYRQNALTKIVGQKYSVILVLKTYIN